jgi:hypothetical protein
MRTAAARTATDMRSAAAYVATATNMPTAAPYVATATNMRTAAPRRRRGIGRGRQHGRKNNDNNADM